VGQCRISAEGGWLGEDTGHSEKKDTGSIAVDTKDGRVLWYAQVFRLAAECGGATMTQMGSSLDPRDDFSLKYEKALDHCQEMIDWYNKQKFWQRVYYQVSQILTILLSGITPILILVDQLPELIQAIPPAIVTILVGLGGIFQWKENWLQYAQTHEELRSEKLKFETRSREYGIRLNATTALDRFVTRVSDITLGEVSEWQERMRDTSAAMDLAEGDTEFD
jgi:hypothetical protein